MFKVQRAAILINIPAIGRGVDHGQVRTETAKQFGCKIRGSTVCAIDHDSPACEVESGEVIGQMVKIRA